VADPNIQAQEEPEEKEDWLVTYADAITLLMAFMVMLVSFSKVDIPLHEKVAAGIAEEIGGSKNVSTTELMKLDVEDIVYTMQADEVVSVGTDDDGVVIELASSAFYKPGSADIRDEALPVIGKMAQSVMAPRYRNFMPEIEGHTDDDPISTAKFPSNWELSADRATCVVRFLIEQGMDSARLKAVGYGESRPTVPNRTADGAPIRDNQAENRRVNIRVFPMSMEERREMQRQSTIQDLIEEAPAEDASPATGAPGELAPAR
jgi:chemotaxis protein MotB